MQGGPAEEKVTVTEFGIKSTYTRLGAAILKRDVRAVKKFLDEGADVENPVSDELTALQMAAEHGYSEIVRLLLDRGADPNGTAGSEQPPILQAFSDLNENGADIISMLLKNGAKVDVAAKSRFGGDVMPPIVRAPKLGLKVVNLLIAHGADIHMRTFEWDDAVHVTLLPPWHLEIMASFVRDQERYHETRSLEDELDEVFRPNGIATPGNESTPLRSGASALHIH